ncbi:MAG TPA: hypothetical protein PLY87_02685 [Planctomycetaceae bacterium]|nr:hypothetical protein [Planctomycetaceae bacterium]HQZ63950.1 hypothetical protein [Planctomycetaceae bacterium]
MKPATLFPNDDIHDSADDWKKTQASADRDSEPRPPNSSPAVHSREIGNRRDDRQGARETPELATTAGAVPLTRRNTTLTSRAAAESVRSCGNSQAVRVWGFIDSQGEHGATDKEIQAGLQLDGNSERPRRVWLMRNGFVKPKGAPCVHVVRERSIVWVVARPLNIAPPGSSAAELSDTAGERAEESEPATKGHPEQ